MAGYGWSFEEIDRVSGIGLKSAGWIELGGRIEPRGLHKRGALFVGPVWNGAGIRLAELVNIVVYSKYRVIRIGVIRIIA